MGEGGCEASECAHMPPEVLPLRSVDVCVHVQCVFVRTYGGEGTDTFRKVMSRVFTCTYEETEIKHRVRNYATPTTTSTQKGEGG